MKGSRVQRAAACEALVFPSPKEIEYRRDRPFRLDGDTVVVLRPEPSDDDLQTGDYLARQVYEAIGRRLDVLPGLAPPERGAIYLGEPAGHPQLRALCRADLPGPEGYVLDATGDRIVVAGSDPAGTFRGVQTLLQLAQPTGTGSLRVPSLRIRDWPEMPYRGIFVECAWGSDLMELKDWQECIDTLAELKLNVLGVGIYGCWGVQFRGETTQYMMVPIQGRPELKTPVSLEYYSPSGGGWRELDYLPPMYERDFFGEVVAYGKKRHVSVQPYFNSFGHNRLIPRAYPESSSKDADGRPIGSGFCTSSPRTYEVLFDCYDQIIDRYLAPNGADMFHIQMDEMSEWCKCPACRDLPTGKRCVEHLLKLGEHLAGKGIRHIGVWDDTLRKHGELNAQLVKALDERGLKDKLFLHWFMYGPEIFETIMPELGLRSRLAPMTGFKHNYLAAYEISHFQNIYRMLRLGHRDRAEGAEPYGIFDRGYHRYYCCLSEFTWNRPSGPDCEHEDLYDFTRRYVSRWFGPHSVEMLEAIETLHAAYTEPLGRGLTSLSALAQYTYSCRDRPDDPKPAYPEVAFRQLVDDPAQQRKLRRVAARLAHVRRVVSGMDRGDLPRPALADELEAECTRFASLADVFLTLLEVEADYQALRRCSPNDRERIGALITAIAAGIEQIKRLQLQAMTRWEQVKAPYLRPHNLRVMSLMLRCGEELSETLRGIRRELSAEADPAALPETLIRGTTADY